MALSVASTVVLLRVLQERRLLDTERGRITVGWLIVQDIAMVLVLVLLPGLTALFHGMETAPGAVEIVRSITILLGKFAIFVAVMLLVGKKLIPAILHYVAHTGQPRAVPPGRAVDRAWRVAYAAAELFGISLALGAFFAGMMLSESQLSQQAATESLPLRDAFAVLFFVSVGMLFDPAVLLAAPLALLATVVIILIGKSVVAFFVVRLFGHARSDGADDLGLAGADRRILLHPRRSQPRARPSAGRWPQPDPCRRHHLHSGQSAAVRRARSLRGTPRQGARRGRAADAREEEVPMREPIRPTTLRNHVVLVGHGRVGSFISSVLGEQSVPLFVIEDNEDGVAALRQEGIAALEGNAADPAVIEAANLPEARCLLVAIPDAFEGGQVVQQAHAINPSLPIIARAHSEEEIDYLKRHGATLVVMGEHEIAKAMLDNVAQIALLVAQSSREAAAVQPQSMPVEKAASTS